MRKKIVLQMNISKMITVILLSVAFVTKLNSITVPWYFCYLVCCPLIPFLLVEYYNDKYREVKRMTVCVLFYALIPYLAGLAYTLLLMLFHNSGRLNPTVRAISEIGQMVYILFFTALVFAKFREEVIDILSEALVLSYLYSLIVAFVNIGVSGFVEYISTVALNRTEMVLWFERHDIGLSIGMLLMCELFMRKKKRPMLIMMMFIVMYLCHKRIAFCAFAVMIVLQLCVRKSSDEVKIATINIVLISVSVICMVYIWLIASGHLYSLSEQIGIDFSGRKNLFDAVKDLYRWSVAFQGNGFGFTGKYLSSIAGTSYAHKLGSETYKMVHSDILKTYVDLGFTGSMLWFIWQTWKFPTVIAHKFGQDAKVTYCLVTVYTYIIYMTDNTSTYFIFQVVLYSVVMYGCYMSSNRDMGLINFLRSCTDIKNMRRIKISVYTIFSGRK